jgi:ATP synthase protein I
MPQPDDTREEALKRLGEDLKAFDAKRAGSAQGGGTESAGEAYRLAAGVISGVLGGLGLGWSLDYFAHTRPIGLIGGLLIGLGGSIFMAVRRAGEMSARMAASASTPPAGAPDDDED